MRDEHIIIIIENAPLASLGEDALSAIRAHTRSCSDCLQAFQAAQVSQRLLKERAAVEFEPSPFFHTRVLATLRERQAAANNSWAFSRMWRSTGALASSMAAAVALLAVLTFVVPETQVTSQQMSFVPNGYSAEEVILDQTSQVEDVSDGQLLTTIYGAEEEASR
jgi:hypothetical protein